MNTEESNRLDALERRLERIEAALNLRPPEAPHVPTAVVAPPPVIPRETLPPVKHTTPTAAHSPEVVTPPPTRATEPAAREKTGPTEQGRNTALGTKAIDGNDEEQEASGSIERSLGLHWAGWAGAGAVVIAAGLGIKFAYEQGWFEHLPPGARVLLMAFGGFLLIGLGEWVYRKINRFAASALFGAGVAVLFVVAYAGHAYYALYPAATAFWLSGLATLIGAALSVRGNLAAVAVLSLLGGAIAPLELSTGQPPGESLLIYMLLLQVLALYLAWWGNAPKWWALRMLSFLANCIWFAVVIDGGAVNRYNMLAFSLFSSSLYQSEMIASSVRYKGDAKNALLSKQAHDSISGLFSVIVTVVLAATGLWLLRDEARYMRTTWVLCLAFFFAWQSLILPRLLGERARTLARAFQIETALLLMMAVPVALHGDGIAMGWAAVAVAFAFQARFQTPGLALGMATATLMIGAGYWFFRELIDSEFKGVSRPLVFNMFTLNGTVLMTAYYIVGWITERIDAAGGKNRFGALRSLLWGVIPLLFLWDGSCEIHHYFQPGNAGWFSFSAAEQVTLSSFWALTSIAMIVLGFGIKATGLRFGGLAMFGLTLLKVVVVDGSNLGSGYRVLSFLGVGALLITTSVLYGKFKGTT